MKVLLIHADRFEFEVKSKAIEDAEVIGEGDRRGFMDEVLVVFCTVEKMDERNIEGVVVRAAGEIASVASNLKVKNIIIYPYAHLSSSLGSPEASIPILRGIADALSSNGFNVRRSPFGYYKSFKIECKGHPLAELSRTITVEEAGKAQPVETKYMVLNIDGELIEPELYMSYPDSEFKTLVEKEALRRGLLGGEPKYLEYCRKFGVEWEPYSDVGHMRYGPEGDLLFELIGEYAWLQARSLGIPVLRVRGTNMFDLSIRPVREHAKLFGDRLYEINLDGKSFVLRYAACHQQFSMVKDWYLSYRHLPFGTFEVADSYRLEQSGELLLCFRVRKLHMPDLHIYCKDLEESKEMARRVHERIYSEIRKLGREYVSIYNTTRTFFEENRSLFMDLLRVEGKPILLNFVPEDLYYWVLNVEYTIIDDLNRPREIATFQIDIGNAKRFNITYVDRDGQKKYPPIIHTALIGTVERYLFTVLDCAAKAERMGGKPQLPLWLSPIQVRIVPVTMNQLEYAKELSARLAGNGVRVDVDDRDETLQKRIREAEVEWIPYIVVLGEREVGGETFPVRVRGASIKNMTLKDLVSEIKSKIEGYPTLPSPLPPMFSQRPTYHRT
ncbi:MAG: threonine--tRNA ligase [Candidatus Bathyarchaeia archaeon]|nr:threonine--tRNA ligase [Candidatus Bathyarchaeota archaeon]